MNQSVINIEQIVNHWIKSSDEDLDTMEILFNSGRYSWTLFMGHISTEKLLKAYYTKKKGGHAPYIHNLYRLAELSELVLTEEYADWFDEITAFNINARYDDYKQEFYSICTLSYATEWFNKIKILRQWIKNQLSEL
ncbi:MAG: HEPN domain-containing protein [Dysgonamonadaceae bacterium]|jgi:HEPN domain-containing protein|nr:HEPN domain-containing protein [Dysgonamonadaceae bacterium]